MVLGHWEAPMGCRGQFGASGGVRVYLGLAGTLGTQGPEGYRGHQGHWGS